MRVDRVECPKCGGKMEVGYILDVAHGSNLVSNWIEGAPEHSTWTGVKLKGRRKLPTSTYRCSKCGYLESYATGLA